MLGADKQLVIKNARANATGKWSCCLQRAWYACYGRDNFPNSNIVDKLLVGMPECVVIS